MEISQLHINNNTYTGCIFEVNEMNMNRTSASIIKIKLLNGNKKVPTCVC